MKIVAAYIRVSTDDQLEYSPDSQLKAIREYAKKNDMILPDEYIFVDEGISGRKTQKREAFNKMIGIAKTKPKPFDAILLWKFSRFARNREDSIVYKSMLRKQLGIDVISISENLGDDKMSILIEALIEAMDEFYSINLSEEVRRGMSEKATRGGVLGPPAYGYKVQDGNYVPSDKADIVRMIFNDFANGMNYREITLKLNTMGERTTNNNLWEIRHIKRILENPVYIGHTRWCKSGKFELNKDDANVIFTPNTHEPIISDQLWQQVQENIEITRRKYPKYSRPGEPVNFMLKGIVRCSACGATLVNSSKGIQCYNYAHGTCKESHFINKDKIDKLFIDTLISDFETGDFEIIPRNFVPAYDDEYVKTALTHAQTKLDRAREAYQAGIDSLDEYKKSKEQIQKEIKEIESKIREAKPTRVNKKKFIKRCLGVIKSLNSNKITIQEKNDLIRSFVHSAIFSRKDYKLTIFYYM